MGKILLGSIVLLGAILSASFVGYGVISGNILYDGHHHHHHMGYFDDDFNDHCYDEGNIYCSSNETDWCTQETDDFCQVNETGDCFEYNEGCLEEVETCHYEE